VNATFKINVAKAMPTRNGVFTLIVTALPKVAAAGG
jgi:hypothetical protein